MKTRKGFGEIQFIIFIAVFITLFGILGMMFKTQIMTQKEQETSMIDKMINGITGVLAWVGDHTLGQIPVVKTFWTIASATINVEYIHPYLGMLYLAFFGMPLGYIIVRLIRGGG